MTTPESGMPSRHRRIGRNGRILTWAAASLAAAGAALLIFRKTKPTHRQDEESGRGTPSTPPSGSALKQGHEVSDMSGRLMMWLTIGLGGSVAAVIGLMMLLSGFFHHERQDSQPPLTIEQTATINPPKPNLQVDGVSDLAQMHKGEDLLLHNYAWIDAGHTRARIPIARAMTLMVGRTLDAAP